VRLKAVLAAAALLTAACAGGRAERARTLPLDHSAAVLYVALGDSTVEGIGASNPSTNYVSRLHDRLRAVYPRARVVNLGLGGATSADVAADQLERAVLLRPQLVTLSIGPNDITGHVPVREYERHVDTIFRRLTQETSAVVVANLLPDLAVTPRFRGRETTTAVDTLTSVRRRGRRSVPAEPGRDPAASRARSRRRLSSLGPGLRALGRAAVDGGRAPDLGPLNSPRPPAVLAL
jgi:lysophospholipase L1-like esterase